MIELTIVDLFLNCMIRHCMFHNLNFSQYGKAWKAPSSSRKKQFRIMASAVNKMNKKITGPKISIIAIQQKFDIFYHRLCYDFAQFYVRLCQTRFQQNVSLSSLQNA